MEKNSHKYPIGVQGFEKLRKDGYVYIDKTKHLYNLINEGNCYFLSRPRRFGKSLFLSTLQEYFSGKKELFEGTFIATKEKEWLKYPVMKLDLNAEQYNTPEKLEGVLNDFLCKQEEIYGTRASETSFGLRFQGIIKRASEMTNMRVVILIDEYDKPLLQAIGNEVLQTEYRNTLKAFYGVLKSCDAHIKFAFLTGVTKFGKVSVFSDLNNLKDITMLPGYSNICGITERELHDNFDDGVKELAENNSLTREECYERLRRDFDGYHFNEYTKEGIYNPFSVLNTLDNRRARRRSWSIS